MSSVTHFEIYASDPSNLASFYYVLFGWRLAKAPGIDYWWIQTEPGHTNEFNGRLMHRPIPEPRRWAHNVNVDSLDEAIARVQQLGWLGITSEDGSSEDRLVRSSRRPRGKHLCGLAG
jgi:predicted enzyme related to lactoylglutathione lyase